MLKAASFFFKYAVQFNTEDFHLENLCQEVILLKVS